VKALIKQLIISQVITIPQLFQYLINNKKQIIRQSGGHFKMKITIKLIYPLTIAMLLTGASSAFATDVSTQTTTAGINATTEATNTQSIDPRISQIDSLYNQIITLRQKDTSLNLTIKTQHQLNENALKSLSNSKLSTDLAKIKIVEDTNKTLADNNKSTFSQIKSLESQIKSLESDKTKEKEKVELRLQINELRKQVAPIISQMKSNSDSIKSNRDNVKSYRTQLVNIINSIKSQNDKIKDLTAKDKVFQQQKNLAWKSFNDFIKNADADGAITSLTNIVSIKQQIIDNKQNVLEVLKQIGVNLSATLTTDPTPTPTIEPTATATATPTPTPTPTP
jgi:hypothetical protein